MGLLDGINDTENELYTFDSIIETETIKGSDALKELKEACATHMGRMVYILQEDKFDIIEKELKDYYALKKECEEAKWYQEHKALKIIKETLKITFNDEELTIGIDDVYFLTFKDKTKYDLLKEVSL